MPATYASAVHNLLELGHELASNRKFDLAHMRRLAETLGHNHQTGDSSASTESPRITPRG